MREIIITVYDEDIVTTASLLKTDDNIYKLFVEKSNGDIIELERNQDEMDGTVANLALNDKTISAEGVLSAFLSGVEHKALELFLPIINAKFDLAAQEERDLKNEFGGFD